MPLKKGTCHDDNKGWRESSHKRCQVNEGDSVDTDAIARLNLWLTELHISNWHLCSISGKS